MKYYFTKIGKGTMQVAKESWFESVTSDLMSIGVIAALFTGCIFVHNYAQGGHWVIDLFTVAMLVMYWTTKAGMKKVEPEEAQKAVRAMTLPETKSELELKLDQLMKDLDKKIN